MRILAATPGHGSYDDTTYIVELSSDELAALTIFERHGAIPVTRNSVPLTRENCRTLKAGDEISPNVFKEVSYQVTSLLQNDVELKKAINFVRGAMTKIENAITTKKEEIQ